MRATSVLCRFLSLLDVTLILLGMLMIILTQAQMRTKMGQATASENLRDLARVDFFYLYAGTHGEERGRCYLLGPEGQKIRQVRTDTLDDLRLSMEQPGTGGSKNRAIVLLVSDQGFDSMWGDEKLAEMEAAWRMKIIPVHNVNLTKRP